MQIFGFSSFGGVNNNGTVAAGGLFTPPSFPPGSAYVFTHDGSAGGLVALGSGPPVLNNNNVVFFGGGHMAFTHSGGVTMLIATVGDVIDGKTLSSGGIGAVDLNNNGVVIILGSLEDNSGPIGQAILLATPDLDGDGIPDDEDHCPNSDLSPTVVIDSCDSGVENDLLGDGCTIADQVYACAANASNHGRFVSCVTHLTNDLKKAGIITGQEKGAIVRCAAQADIP